MDMENSLNREAARDFLRCTCRKRSRLRKPYTPESRPPVNTIVLEGATLRLRDELSQRDFKQTGLL